MTGSSVPKESVTPRSRTEVGDTNLGLFSVGGPFEDFPGAVLVAAHNGIVLSANDVAEPIARMLKAGGPPELREAVASALSGKAAQVNPLVTPLASGQDGAPRAYDIVILPWGEGTAALLLGRDITLERSLRSALVESRQRFKGLVELACDFAWETDAKGLFTFVTSEAPLGYDPAELLNSEAASIVVEERIDGASPFAARESMEGAEVWARDASGTTVCLSVSATPLYGSDGRWLGARGVCWDVTVARGREAALADTQLHERLLNYILHVVRGEPQPRDMLGAAAEALMPALSLLGVGVYELFDTGATKTLVQTGRIPEDDAVARALRQAQESGGVVETVDVTGRLLGRLTRCQDQENGFVLLWRAADSEPWGPEESHLLAEVSAQVGLAIEQLARESELKRLSSIDTLTGLLNRRGFEKTLEHRMARGAASAQGGVLLYIDLDNFKQVNDTHGHNEGDRVLTTVANILKGHIRHSDLAARLGGDEFAIFLVGMTREGAEARGRALLAEARQLEKYSGDPEHPLGMSVGIADFAAASGEGLASLLDRADRAMYEVKRAGRGALRLAASLPKREGT